MKFRDFLAVAAAAIAVAQSASSGTTPRAFQARFKGHKITIPVLGGWSWSDPCKNRESSCPAGIWTGPDGTKGSAFATSLEVTNLDDSGRSPGRSIEVFCAETFKKLSPSASSYRFHPTTRSCSWQQGTRRQYMTTAGNSLVSFTFNPASTRPNSTASKAEGSSQAFLSSAERTMGGLAHE